MAPRSGTRLSDRETHWHTRTLRKPPSSWAAETLNSLQHCGGLFYLFKSFFLLQTESMSLLGNKVSKHGVREDNQPNLAQDMPQKGLQRCVRPFTLVIIFLVFKFLVALFFLYVSDQTNRWMQLFVCAAQGKCQPSGNINRHQSWFWCFWCSPEIPGGEKRHLSSCFVHKWLFSGEGWERGKTGLWKPAHISVSSCSST